MGPNLSQKSLKLKLLWPKQLSYVILPMRLGALLCPTERSSMKLAGFLLLLAGWVIVVAAVILLTPVNARTIFVLAGVAVEIIGLTLVTRSNPLAVSEKD
jgi:hypothetical protein